MMSYRFRRRAFIAAMSGGVGLKIMLRNLESAAQGMRSPPRLLVTHWPDGIVAGANDSLFKPNPGSSVNGSPALKPFADAGLGPDMTVLRGVSTVNLALNGGGGHEGGTVVLVTGRATGGSRANCCEGDDSYATGPSFDQILLANVPALQRPGGPGYANAIADSRTDFAEISTQVLSYSTVTQPVNTYNNGPIGTEAIPLRPVLSPLQQYLNLFGGFAPGTGGAGAAGAAGQGGAGGSGPPLVADVRLKKLVGKRSVLDFAVEELNQLRPLAPSDARSRLSLHTDAVVAAEMSIVNTINQLYPAAGGASGLGGSTGSGGGGGGGASGGNGGPSCGAACTPKPPAPPDVVGMADPDNGRGTGNNFGVGNDTAKQDDAPIHALVGQAHMDVLKAAFICDLIRVGTFSWSPGTNHVGFALDPTNTTPYQHHPRSHRIGTQQTTIGSTPDALQVDARFLYNVELWYFSRMAEILSGWKTAVDGCGNSLLDFTCVPFLTEVQACGHERNNIPAMIIGGKQLGFIHNIYKTDIVTVNQLWGTIAQAYGYTSTDAPFAPPVPGLWSQP